MPSYAIRLSGTFPGYSWVSKDSSASFKEKASGSHRSSCIEPPAPEHPRTSRPWSQVPDGGPTGGGPGNGLQNHPKSQWNMWLHMANVPSHSTHHLRSGQIIIFHLPESCGHLEMIPLTNYDYSEVTGFGRYNLPSKINPSTQTRPSAHQMRHLGGRCYSLLQVSKRSSSQRLGRGGLAEKGSGSSSGFDSDFKMVNADPLCGISIWVISILYIYIKWIKFCYICYIYINCLANLECLERCGQIDK